MHWGKEEQDCRRRERRRSVDLVGLAFRGDGSRSVVSISDISFEGCRLSGGEFEMKEGIRLVIPERGEMGARVRWASKGKSGALFTNDEKLAASVPTHERNAIRRMGSLNYGSGRVFGRKEVAA
jgi:hypothetical protein